ncbi:Gfo/Idh/MocA family oxidoreductase [Streptomyces sp. NBC_01476]|uniref:Gfo/Idh/MocA family protein n=1 Tax=Streptomyces sp. NBC_01476 TaxID=2903881 RepID=UPI002E3514E1|nr:Gfo/Idh/MocA family oxidoreductase [Streptomyces sp. NBC_01476]
MTEQSTPGHPAADRSRPPRIGVGIIGASTGGWASISHVPALKSLQDRYELRAVSTSRRASAQAAAEQSGAAAAYDNHTDLIADPGVDLVVVAVKVTHHRELVTAALDAGKNVYSEWPLGVDLPEAAELVRRAGAAGVRTAIGLQARFAPQVRHARDLIEQGWIGRVLGTTLVGSGISWGPVTDRAHAYWFDAANGVTPLSVPALHALDAVHWTLGEFTDVSANLVTGRTETTLAEDGSTLPVTAPDQVSVIGTLSGGAAASLHYRGGLSRGDNLRWEINGTEGDLVLTSPVGNLQVADLTLAGGRGDDTTVTPIATPSAYFTDVPADLTGPAHNVAQLYAQFARDLREGTSVVPGFDHALVRHRLLATIEEAAATGRRATL